MCLLLLKQIIKFPQRFVLFRRSGGHFSGSFKVVAKISHLFVFHPFRLRLAALVMGGGIMKSTVAATVQIR